MKSYTTVSSRQVFSSPQMLLAFGFGSGLSRIMPGTMGTLVAVAPYLLLVHLPWWAYAVVVVVSFLVGNYLCDYASKQLKVHDHPGIVWDEFVGFWITMFWVPLTWYWVVTGFVLFRFFDMLKPWPISFVDKHVHGGFGIMVDDVLAGLAACLCLQGIVYFSGV